MDEKIEAMCECGWTVTFRPTPSYQIQGTATHAKCGEARATQYCAREVTGALFQWAKELDPALRDLRAR